MGRGTDIYWPGCCTFKEILQKLAVVSTIRIDENQLRADTVAGDKIRAREIEISS